MKSEIKKPDLVQEFVDSAGATLRVDARLGVLRGVKLLGLQSRNGRRYAEGALSKAIGLYEGAKVNVNHPVRDPLSGRDYRDRLGVVRNVRMAPGEGLFGDLHYNPKHALAEQLVWDAENAPENVGLSHNVLARTRNAGEGVVVEAITRVQSVDLVADPATTRGLFEHGEGRDDTEPGDSGLATATEEIAALAGRLRTQERRLRIMEANQRVERTSLLGEHEAHELLEADDASFERLLELWTRNNREARRRAAPISREPVTAPSRTPDARAFVSAITAPL